MAKIQKYKKGKNVRRFYILTVEPLSNTKRLHRLGLMLHDYQELYQQIKTSAKLIVLLNNIEVDCTNAIKVYRNHGRLVAPNLSNWIHANQLHTTSKGKPAKIIFELKIRGKIHRYILYPYQLNLVCQSKKEAK